MITLDRSSRWLPKRPRNEQQQQLATRRFVWLLSPFVNAVGTALLVIATGTAPAQAQGLITRIAGSANGTPGFAGDGGPGVNALLNTPQGVAVDSSGNVYIGDSFNYRVRRVSPDGSITTVAGNGSTSFFGDDGPATSAGVFPSDVALDGLGNLYIDDESNERVRKVDLLTGIITTIAGGGTNCGPGFQSVINGEPATSACLFEPMGVAADSAGNIYIASGASANGGNIFKVNAQGIITTGLAVNGPRVAVDARGNLYVSGGTEVAKVDATGRVTTVAGNGTAGFSGDGGPATGAEIKAYGIAVDGLGNLYIADLGNHRVRRVNSAGIITTVAGNGTAVVSGEGGPAIDAGLVSPAAVTADDQGNIYIADSGSNRVLEVTAPANQPGIFGGGVVNNASYAPSPAPVAPGSIAAVFGTSLNDGSSVPFSSFGPDGKLVTTLGGTSATINNIPAPMFYSFPSQLGVQIPFEMAGQTTANIVVTVGGQASVPRTINLDATAPGIFTVNQQGTGIAAVLHSDGATPVTVQNPAHPNEGVVFFATGLGALTSPLATGAPSVGNQTVARPTVMIDGISVIPDFSGAAPGFVGLNQINVRIPASTRTASNIPVLVTIGGKQSNQVTIPVGP
jgi:uncharacterized protein (TIGR03437 family)